jgi:hypothetical protein
MHVSALSRRYSWSRSLKVLDLKRPIREANMPAPLTDVSFSGIRNYCIGYLAKNEVNA